MKIKQPFLLDKSLLVGDLEVALKQPIQHCEVLININSTKTFLVLWLKEKKKFKQSKFIVDMFKNQ